MYKCPACGVDVERWPVSCQCGADLLLLATLDAVVDGWYNRGLAALGRGACGEALEWFSACCVARPTDGEARVAQAKIWAQLGRWQEAGMSLARARDLGVDAAELAAVEEGINEKMTGVAGEHSHAGQNRKR
jgi:hypothetical protein